MTKKTSVEPSTSPTLRLGPRTLNLENTIPEKKERQQPETPRAFSYSTQEKEIKYDGTYLIENDFLPQDIAPYSDFLRQIAPVVAIIPYQTWENSSGSSATEKRSVVISRPAVHVKSLKDIPLLSYIRKANDLQNLIKTPEVNTSNATFIYKEEVNENTQETLDKKIAQLTCTSGRIHTRILPLTASSVVSWQLFQLNAQVIRNKGYEAKDQNEFFEIPWFNTKNGESIERALGLIPQDWVSNIPNIKKRINFILTKGRSLEIAVDPYTALTVDHKNALLSDPSFRTFLLNAIKNSYWCVTEAAITQGTGKFEMRNLPYPFIFPGALLLYYPVNPPFMLRMYPVLYSGDTSSLIDTNAAFFALGEILRVYNIPAQVIEELKEIYQTSVSFVVKAAKKKESTSSITRLDQLYIDRIYVFFTKTLPDSLRKTLDLQTAATGHRALVYRQSDEEIVFGYTELETFIKSLGTRLLLHTEFDMSSEQNARKLQEISQVSLRKIEAAQNNEAGTSFLGALKGLFGKKPDKKS